MEELPINRNILRRGLHIRHLEDPTFRKHFRMNKVLFERFVLAVGPQLSTMNLMQRERTSVPEGILMGLWILNNPDTFRSEGLNFDVSPSVVHRHYKRLIHVLCGIGNRYIKWPSAAERRRTALFYERNFGFPGAVLSIDGTLIPIVAPREQKQRYIDRFHKYSMNVQIVSDHRKLIRDIYIGQPGSVNDSRVFRRSPLARNLYSREEMLTNDEHLIGDGAYVTTTKLLTPYKDFGDLTPSHRNYNMMLSQCRATVEALNGLFKLRLSRLRRLFCKSIETTVYHIGASAVVHNFVLLQGQESDGLEIEGDPPNIDVQAAIAALEEAGREKRRFIRMLLYPEEEVIDN